ncbi:hypothetical protein ACTXT7_015608 [Hymenolepis weldensis]
MTLELFAHEAAVTSSSPYDSNALSVTSKRVYRFPLLYNRSVSFKVPALILTRIFAQVINKLYISTHIQTRRHTLVIHWFLRFPLIFSVPQLSPSLA